MNTLILVNIKMTEKEIERKFKADFRELFPKLKDATAVPVAALSKDSSEVGKMLDIILRLKVGDKPKNLLCEVSVRDTLSN